MEWLAALGRALSFLQSVALPLLLQVSQRLDRDRRGPRTSSGARFNPGPVPHPGPAAVHLESYGKTSLASHRCSGAGARPASTGRPSTRIRKVVGSVLTPSTKS